MHGIGRLAMLAIIMCVCMLSPSLGSAACKTSGKLRQICGLQTPEDLELLPGGRRLLISEMVGPQGEPGKFAVLDLVHHQLSDIVLETSPPREWGEPDCKQRPATQISPHGFHLSRLSSGRQLLLAVNHGAMESVQAYALIEARNRIRLAWLGCVESPYNFNDLAATPDGFIGAHQYDKPMGEGPDAVEHLFGGGNTGHAERWSKAGGFQIIPMLQASVLP